MIPINLNETYEVTVTLVGGTEQKIARLNGQQVSTLLETASSPLGVYIMNAGGSLLAISGRNIASVLARPVTR